MSQPKTGFDTWVEKQMQNPDFAAEYSRARAEIAAADEDRAQGGASMREFSPGPWRSGRQDMVSYTMVEGEDGGPWKNIYGNETETHPRTGDQIPVAVARAYGKTEEEALARALLIAAAPEMYALLQTDLPVIMPMAYAYAEAGGAAGPEIREFNEFRVKVMLLLARIDGKETP